MSPRGRRPPGVDQLPGDRVVKHLRQEIARAQPGDQLPTRVDLVTAFGFTSVTVGRAYDRLVAEGLVDARRYQGYYKPVASRMVWDRTRALEPRRMAALKTATGGHDTWAYDADCAGYSHHQEVTEDIATGAHRIGRAHLLADLFETEQSTLFVVHRRIQHLGPEGGPAEAPDSLVNDYYLRDMVVGGPLEHPGDADPMAALAEAGHRPVGHHEMVTPRLVGQDEAAALALTIPAAVTEVIRVSRTSGGDVVMVQHVVTATQVDYHLHGRT